MDIKHKIICIAILILMIISINGSSQSHFLLRVFPSATLVRIDSWDSWGYDAKALAYGFSLSRETPGISFRLQYNRFSWSRDYIAKISYWPYDTLPDEEIHESAVSNSISVRAFKKWQKENRFSPYLGAGLTIHFALSEATGQDTHIHRKTSSFWYAAISIMGGVDYPLTNKIIAFSELDYCPFSAAITIVKDGYVPANSIQTNSISLGIGYKF